MARMKRVDDIAAVMEERTVLSDAKSLVSPHRKLDLRLWAVGCMYGGNVRVHHSVHKGAICRPVETAD